jgi:small subunit ribosomal protein S8
MNINDPVGDLITRIRNAHLRGRAKTQSPASTLRVRVLQVLKDEGYIRDFREIENEGRKELEIELKYFEGAPAIHEIQRVSKPGRRVYSSIKDLRLVRNGLGISIISTPKGVMSDNAAREANVGGEILCEVY